MTTSLSFVVTPGDHKHERILTMNALNNTHRAVYAKVREYWRDAFQAAATGHEQLAWCDVTVDHIKPTRRNVDVAAPVACVKAGVDGIVRAGVLVDDTPEFVRSITFNAPTYQAGVEALVLTLRGPVAATTPCRQCAGTGTERVGFQSFRLRCHVCDGSGRVDSTEPTEYELFTELIEELEAGEI